MVECYFAWYTFAVLAGRKYEYGASNKIGGVTCIEVTSEGWLWHVRVEAGWLIILS